MDAEGGRQQLMDASSRREEGWDFTSVSREEESSVVNEETSSAVVDDEESDVTISGHTRSFSSPDVLSSPKPAPSYIALIAKVILSSPSKKLSLGSIYRAMEDRFPHLRSRGPGWRNSVRHNLSVNDCFVKVSRCEDGRGHYWGVHQAQLRDFQVGDFKQYRSTRGRRGRGRDDGVTRYLAWMERRCLLGMFSESRSGTPSWVRPQRPLEDPGRNMNFFYWIHPSSQPWDISQGPVEPPTWMRHPRFPERPPDSHGKATAGHQLTSNHPRQETASMLIRPDQVLWFPGCWCTCPVVKELTDQLLPKVTL